MTMVGRLAGVIGLVDWSVLDVIGQHAWTVLCPAAASATAMDDDRAM